ncbi:DsbA family protein [Nocardioides sp. SOB77]|uniref:DsbA family protein n=1 Tax=Nocardioides oceani TaxID=3058369 RepID=A0ABT8FL17_9ACTN|nr:DsbA family protein [Nocardioides oceani]MDN4175211.1 DsbA family protein [Nocardioides oceani]
MPESRKSPVVPIVVAVIAALALAFVLAQGALGGDDRGVDNAADVGASPTDPPAGWDQLVRRVDGDPMAVGAVDAPVVIIAYSDFQCPFCGKFARETEPVLVEKYVEDGTLRIEWRDFPYLGPESTVAARGGRAAAAQDRFWEFQRAMYANQLPPNSGKLDEDHLMAVAKDLDLDVGRFSEDLASPVNLAAIQDDFAEGQGIGVTGTPAFIINGVPVIGAQPLEVFEQAIEKAAQEAG